MLILAAGASKRMGKPKQLLSWGGSTLLGNAIDQATKSKATKVFVILGAQFEKIKKSITQSWVTILKNNDWEMGMGNSIACGVRQIQTQGFDAVLIMLIDQPQVDTAFLNKLMTVFAKGQHRIVATSYHKGAGVPAIFDKSYFNQLTSLKGEKGGKQLIQEHLTEVISITPKTPFKDIDTLEAYELAKSLAFSKSIKTKSR